MHDSVLTWGRTCLETIGPIETVLEIGSHDVNGSLRPYADAASYLGIDTVEGPGVDKVMDGLDAVNLGTFDVVIMTEVLEHAEHWAALLMVAKACVRPGGHLLVTTRSPGYRWHGEMYREDPGCSVPGCTDHEHRTTWTIGDHWRFTVRDLERAFDVRWRVHVRADPDPERPGVFVFAQRSRWPAPVYVAEPMAQP